MSRVFANGPGDPGFNPRSLKTLKIVLDTSLLNTQRYKIRVKGKVEQSREKISALPVHLGVVAIEKGAFWSPSTTVANLLFYSISMTDLFRLLKVVRWNSKSVELEEAK